MEGGGESEVKGSEGGLAATDSTVNISDQKTPPYSYAHAFYPTVFVGGYKTKTRELGRLHFSYLLAHFRIFLSPKPSVYIIPARQASDAVILFVFPPSIHCQPSVFEHKGLISPLKKHCFSTQNPDYKKHHIRRLS